MWMSLSSPWHESRISPSLCLYCNEIWGSADWDLLGELVVIITNPAGVGISVICNP